MPNSPQAPLAKVATQNDVFKAWCSEAWKSQTVRLLVIWGLILCIGAWLLLPKSKDKSESTQFHIRRVFQQDKAIAYEMENKLGFIEKFWNASAVLAEWSAKMDAVDLTGCPQEFQAAYKKHVAAWKALAYFQSNNAGLKGFLKSFATAGVLAVPIMLENDQVGKEVNATFAELKQIAIKHGVAP